MMVTNIEICAVRLILSTLLIPQLCHSWQNSFVPLKLDPLWQSPDDMAEADTSAENTQMYSSPHDWEAYLVQSSPPPRANNRQQQQAIRDPFWEQIRLDAKKALQEQASLSGPQLYQGILSQRSLLIAICTVISHEIQTPLVAATEIRDLFLNHLTVQDEYAMRLDLQAVVTRSPSIETAMEALLFHKGFHSLCCYRLGHRLWKADRLGLAYYMQSIVSNVYSADIHPACQMGYGLYVRGAGSGIVIGETATVGNDVSILQGVTLGGTGKEAGDRHPKVGHGVILQDGCTVMGNIPVGDGSIVMAKSIVTKPVDPLAIVSGVPAKVVGARDVLRNVAKEFDQDDMHEHLKFKYLEKWQAIAQEQITAKELDESKAL